MSLGLRCSAMTGRGKQLRASGQAAERTVIYLENLDQVFEDRDFCQLYLARASDSLAGQAVEAMLRLVLPKGSLRKKRRLILFCGLADLGVKALLRRGLSRQHCRSYGSHEVRILRPQEIPVYVAEGLFDLGITGRDWIEETGAEVVSLGQAALLQADAGNLKYASVLRGRC